MAKFNKNWYALPDKLNIENGKMMLKGTYQDGFEFLYTDGGFPIYQKQIYFPNDITQLILKVVEKKQNKIFRNTYNIPFFEINWSNPDLICNLLEMTFVYGLCLAVNIQENQ